MSWWLLQTSVHSWRQDWSIFKSHGKSTQELALDKILWLMKIQTSQLRMRMLLLLYSREEYVLSTGKPAPYLKDMTRHYITETKTNSRRQRKESLNSRVQELPAHLSLNDVLKCIRNSPIMDRHPLLFCLKWVMHLVSRLTANSV